MSVQLIDPIKAVNKYSFANGVPEYENLFIFAELTAQRRGRTIIMSQGSGVFSVEKTINSDLTVNMLGPDRETNTFTTNWSSATSAVKGVTEGFGIKKINVTTNASFIPIVNIEFLDVRGLSLFNSGKDSPYSVLHDFPPPMFRLTLKGYYGKSLTYDLHLKTQNTTFDGETGNYLTNAEFVARTFAPLSDVLFKYAEMFPLIRKDTAKRAADEANASPTNTLEAFNRGIEPKGIHNLIKNIETTYQKVETAIQSSEEKEIINRNEKDFRDLNTVIFEVNKFSNGLGKPYNSDNTALLKEDTSDLDIISNTQRFGYPLHVIPNVETYLKTFVNKKGFGVKKFNTLYLDTKLSTEIVEPNEIRNTPDKYTNEGKGINFNTEYNTSITALNKYRKRFVETYPLNFVRDIAKVDIDNEAELSAKIPMELKYTLEYVEGEDKYKKTYYNTLNVAEFYQEAFQYMATLEKRFR
jgi:hypothetical protein